MLHSTRSVRAYICLVVHYIRRGIGIIVKMNIYRLRPNVHHNNILYYSIPAGGCAMSTISDSPREHGERCKICYEIKYLPVYIIRTNFVVWKLPPASECNLFPLFPSDTLRALRKVIFGCRIINLEIKSLCHWPADVPSYIRIRPYNVYVHTHTYDLMFPILTYFSKKKKRFYFIFYFHLITTLFRCFKT